LTESLNTLSEPDGRVIFAYRDLWLLYTWLGQPEKGMKQLEKLLGFHEKHGNTAGIVATLGLFKGAYAMKGNWKKADSVIKRGDDLLKCLESAMVSARFNILSHSFEDCPWILIWMGRYRQAELHIDRELKFFKDIQAINTYLYFAKDRSLVLGLQGRYQKSFKSFAEALEQRRQEKDRNEAEIAGLLGYWGLVSIRKGDLDKAEEYLKESLRIKEKLKDEVGIPEVKNWLGELYETKSHSLEGEEKVATLKFAKACYEQSLGLRRLDRCYFEGGALIGLARVSYWLGDYSTMQSYLTEAEGLIHQYEYNDYAAVSRLMQGHLMWLSNTMQNSIDETRFNQILISYKESLIYALRYNRYLLDEILSGRSPRAIPLIKPIISTCQEQGEEGQRMLVALYLWWQEATNELNKPQSVTISTSIGIPLQDAERIVREKEKGDGFPQKAVIEQINRVIS
jgi:tetratricopeptide (TPR) repeat protein